MSPKEITSNTINIQEKLDKSIEQGVNYLHDHQLPNGEFLFYMSGDDAMQSWNLPESSVFPASLIGNCLLSLRNQGKVDEILLSTAHFLHYQMDKGGTWNHHTIINRFRKVCPQDLDDTSCVSHFLREMSFDFPMQTNQKLILDNRRNDGLFYTWLIFRWRPNKNLLYWHYAAKELKYLFKSLVFWYQFECTRYDVDAVVNANILYYLGKRKETQPIIPYLIDVIKEFKENDCDKWYRKDLTVYYFISRNFSNGIIELEEVRSQIIDRILLKFNENNGFGDSSLDTALAISSLINLKYKGKEIINGINFITETQNNNGSWKRRAFYYTGPKKESCYGSEELTTAFCLEALAKFKNSLQD
jgi:hypothetical protein